MWAERCWAAHEAEGHLTAQGTPQALFGIVQGGMDLELRLRSLRQLEDIADFPGFGIGGYSVGESHEVMFETLAPLVSEHMPKGKPRYLMGVGNPTTLVRGVACGIDMYDCVLPTRTARMGSAFSSTGRINLRHARHAHDSSPLDAACTCPVCTGGYTRAYLHHLVRQKEMTASILLSMHNIYFLLDLMRRAREAICAGAYGAFLDDWMASTAAKDW
jgi:queuine tRNA-ribosyltransferase